jgi:hypothetical protein
MKNEKCRVNVHVVNYEGIGVLRYVKHEGRASDTGVKL